MGHRGSISSATTRPLMTVNLATVDFAVQQTKCYGERIRSTTEGDNMANEQEAGIQAVQQRNLELATKVAQLSFDNARKIIELQVNFARTLFEDGVANATEAAAVTDPAEALQVRTRMAQQTAERMLGVTREIAGLTATAQAEIGQLVGQQFAGGSDLSESIQQALRTTGFNPTEALAVAQKTFDAARGAYEQLAKASVEAFNAGTAKAPRKTTK